MSTIRYTVSMPQPETHLFHVEVAVTGIPQPHYDFIMPSWTPGSYLIREFARHVQEFQAFDAAGAPTSASSAETTSWSKLNKNTWRVEAAGGDVTLRYKVYANELTVRTSHLDTSHGYFNGATLFVYLDGQRGHPVDLTVAPAYSDWKVATGLPAAPADYGGGNGGSAGPRPETSGALRYHFRAADYDHLIDCPVEVSNHRLLRFQVDGVPHRIAIWGHGNENPERLRADAQAIVQAARDIFGGLPYDDYLFILHLTERRGGGLEHRNSSTNAVNRWSFRKPADYERAIALLAHEFFHTWNVKRILPANFQDFEYRWETYTRLLWVMEGFTTYYELVLLRRAGLISAERMLAILGERILRLLQTPGRHFQSAESASFDAWIKFYRPDENTQNTTVSYYLKGSLIAMLLDLEIRERTGNARSLDDVLVKTYRDYTLHDRGISDDVVQAICEEVAGGSLQAFFDDYVRGVAELPFEMYLGKAGLAMAYSYKGDEYGERAAGLGVRVKEEAGRTLVHTVFSDGPAYHADISPGDEIIAIDGYRVGKETIGDRLGDRQIGERVTVTYFRRDELRTVEITLGQRPYNRLDITEAAESTAEQRAVYASWLGEK